MRPGGEAVPLPQLASRPRRLIPLGLFDVHRLHYFHVFEIRDAERHAKDGEVGADVTSCKLDRLC
jgi:hypothetical protein